MYNNFGKIFFLFLAFFVLFSSSALADNFLDVNVKHVVTPGGNITVEGHVYNETGSGKTPVQGINITGTITSDINSDVTQADGSFSFNLTAPSSTGEYNITITTNDTTIQNKTAPVYVTNVAGGSIAYTDKKPPFSAESTFTINVTLVNASGQPIQNFLPIVEIFKSNGKNQTSWAVTNLSSGTDSSGRIQFNITVPSGISGQYVIVVEKGALFAVFEVNSGYIIAAGTQTIEGEKAFSFYPGETVNIIAKIRDTNGDPQPPSVVNSVQASVVLPNNTVINLPMSLYENYTGFYNTTFSSTSTPGEYKVKIKANVSGTIVEGYTVFEVKNFVSKLSEKEDFFLEWGGKGSLKPGDVAELDILIVNLTDGSIMTKGTDYECNSTYFNFIGIYYPNGTQVSGVQANFVPGQHMIDQICNVNFTVPTESGVYGMKVNVTIGGHSDIAEGYFAVQNYFLKAIPVSDLGGHKDFETMVSPGENVTISLSAYNISAEAEVNPSLIQNISVTKMIPLEFTEGMTEYKLLENQDYWVYGEGTQEPEVKVKVPSTILGPTLVEIRANISGESVVGNAFFMANYVDGFFVPASGMGGDEGPEGPPVSSCQGIVQFSGMVNEVKTGESAQGVVVQNIKEARNEFTGKDMSSCVSIVNSTPSNSQGQITVYVNFSDSQECSFSGFHFMVFNSTYKGKTAGLPSGVFCKRLNFHPTIRSLGSEEESWRIAPTSPIVVTIENATELVNNTLIDNRSYVVIQMLHNFNPSEGGENMLLANGNLQFNFSSLLW